MIAIDTNILIYSIDHDEPEKRAKACQLLRVLRRPPVETVLPWQVVTEFTRYLRSRQDRGELPRTALLRYLNLYRRWFPIVTPTEAVLDRALDLTGRYSLSHWDSLLVAACLEAGVRTLYTEDMGSPAVLDGLNVVNPFV